MAVASESCRSLAVRLLLKMTMDSHQQRSHVQYILEHSSHALESVLDVASDTEIPVAARIQSIRLLGQWTKILPAIAIPQWLSTPNGIHRAGDLLRDEYIKSEGLQLAMELSNHSAVAKIWIFADIIPVILALAVESGGGLTGGDMVVLDCFQVIQNIFAYTDANSAALVLENPVVLSMVSQFLDLRQGQEFLHPPPVVDESYKDDDLDALLSSNDDSAGIMKKKKKRIMPKLLPAEEDVIGKVLDILRTILDHEKLRKEILRSKRNIGLIGLLWELALFVLPPNDDIAIPCAVPSGELQRKTIHLLADGLAQNAMDSLMRHGGIDRVLHMVCTSSDRGLVQALLYLIRMVLPTDAANEMLMECLAPAPDHYVDNDSNGTDPPQPQQQVGIVHKLLYTAISQLNITTDDELDETLLVGSLGALGLFLTDDAQRSILYKITLQKNEEMNNNHQQSELLTGLLTCLQKRGVNNNNAAQHDFVTFHLWRFLALWMTDATLAEVLRNADAAQFLVNSQHDMAALILGLGLLYLNDERQCGGWTKANVLQALLPHQQWNQKMERLCKEQQQPSSSNNPMYWFFRPEEKVWCTWCEQHVLQIRQQVVREMTTSAHHNGNEQDRALSKIVDDQTQELNTLRIELAKTQRRVEAQGTRTLLLVLFGCF
jgi:hypothetical protein